MKANQLKIRIVINSIFDKHRQPVLVEMDKTSNFYYSTLTRDF